MSQHPSLLKNALVEELSSGKFRLLHSGDSQVPVSNIEFSNRKAARNWAKGRGFIVAETAPDGTTHSGSN